MTCDCIKRMVEREAFGDMHSQVRFQEAAIFGKGGEKVRTYSLIRLVSPKGEIETRVMLHDFCPFCGKPEVDNG